MVVLQQLSEAVDRVRGVRLLNVASDSLQNRSVFTFLGAPRAVKKAAVALVQTAVELLDISSHTGKHPRMGVVDVLPFIPVRRAAIDICVSLAERVGKEIGEHFGIPVYLYEHAAKNPARRSLNAIRDGEFEGFREKIARPEWQPDYGPARVHPKAGVLAVGARYPLVAVNLFFDSTDTDALGRIVERIRGLGGDECPVKAYVVGSDSPRRGKITVSIVNHQRIPLHQVVEEARIKASELGISYDGVEVIGLITAGALLQCLKHYLKLEKFDPAQMLELNLPME